LDFSLTQAQQDLSALSRRILTDRVTPDRLTELERSGSGFDEAVWADLAAAGVLAAALPESICGDGYGLAEQCSILIELGRTLAPAPYLETVVLGAGALSDHPNGYAAAAARGELIITAALAEPVGYDLVRPGTRAERAGSGWRLNGTKTAVPFGAVAGLFLVSTTTPEGAAVFAVEREQAGGGQGIVDRFGDTLAHPIEVGGFGVIEKRQHQHGFRVYSKDAENDQKQAE